MGNIETIKGLYTITKDEILTNISLDAKALLLYGSFGMQDLDRPVDSFSCLSGKTGLLDKKPDYMVIVDSLEDSIRKLGSYYGWEKQNIQKLLALGDYPFGFNLETKEKHRIKGKDDSKIPYKILLFSKDYFDKSCKFENHDIFIPSRMSKRFNIAHVSEGFKDELGEKTNMIRDYFVDLALRSSKDEFTGKEFVEKYLQTTFLAEAYRVFDLYRKKYLKIMDSLFYNIDENRCIPMKDALETMLKEKLEKKAAMIQNGKNLYDASFNSNIKKDDAKLFFDYLSFSLNSLKLVMTKMSASNKVAGGNNLRYVLRKFR